MVDLQHFAARVCLTVAGVLIHEQRVLLVKHKKVGFWLNPGGHLEVNELPHQGAEREFWEETGIKVKAKPYGLMINTSDTEYVPSPFASNLHWVCQDNYEHRVNGTPLTDYALQHWTKGCEQHFNMIFLVEPLAGVEFYENIEETDGIRWFTREEVKKLDTHDQIKKEVEYAFSVTSN